MKKTKQITTTIDIDLWEEIKEEYKRTGVPIARIINRILRGLDKPFIKSK